MAKAKKKEALSLEEKLEQALVPVDEQPYEVPENWCWVKVGSVCVFENGYAFKADKFSEEGSIPVIRISNIKQNEVDVDSCVFTTETDVDSRFIAKYGDLLIAMSGATTGKNGVFLSNVPAYVNQRVGNIKVKNEKTLLPTYRNYYIMAMEEEILRGAYGGAQPNISSNKICDMNMPLPPLAEQQRIVEQIERLFVKLDYVKEKAQTVIEGIDINIEAIFCDAFEGHLTYEWRSKNGITDAWDDTDLSKVVSGLKYGSSEKSDYENKGTPVLRIPNIGDGIIEFSDLKYLSEEIDNTSHEVFENDILVIRSNGSRNLVGRCALVPKLDRKYAYASFLIRLKVSNRVLPQYLVYFLNSSIARIQLFSKAKSSSGIHNINSKELGAIKIKIPSLKEQKQILLVIDSLIKKEKKAREIAEMSIDSVDAMKKSILAKAFRGELGTNNPDEESAVELLKHIIAENL